jgi:hypothetical protein
MTKYPLIIGAIFGIVNVLVYMINKHLNSEKWSNIDLAKMFVHGFLWSAGAIYTFVLVSGQETVTLGGGSEQDIMLGTPDF